MSLNLQGSCDPAFAAVRQAFAENILKRREAGASLCVWHRGRQVVDLWNAEPDPQHGRPFGPDTAAIVFSATKGLVALCFLMLEDRGQIDLDAPVARYWPAFGTPDKAAITVRQVLNHRAGLSVVDHKLGVAESADPDIVGPALAAQVPFCSPGAQQAYGATAWGLYTGEIFRQVTGTPVGRFFADEVAGPLDAKVWIGHPPEAAVRDGATLRAGGARTLTTRILPSLLLPTPEGRTFRRVLFRPASYPRRAYTNPDMGNARLERMNDRSLWHHEFPWMGALATARGLARVYAALAQGGRLDGVTLVRPHALKPLRGRQTWSERDLVLQKPVGWSQGFLKEGEGVFSPNPASFGHAGAGGSLGWADPDAELAIGYVPSRLDWRIRSPRPLRLCQAIYASLS